MLIPAAQISRLPVNNGIAPATVLKKNCKADRMGVFSLCYKLNRNLIWECCSPVGWGFLALAERG